MQGIGLKPKRDIGTMIKNAFTTRANLNRNHDPANVVDGLFAIARGLDAIAEQLSEVACSIDVASQRQG